MLTLKSNLSILVALTAALTIGPTLAQGDYKPATPAPATSAPAAKNAEQQGSRPSQEVPLTAELKAKIAELRATAEKSIVEHQYKQAIDAYRQCIQIRDSAWAHDGLAKALFLAGSPREEVLLEQQRAADIKTKLFNDIKKKIPINHGDFTAPEGKPVGAAPCTARSSWC